MSKNYVTVSLTFSLREAIKYMHDRQQHCVLVVDAEDSLEGILTYGDIKRFLSQNSGDASAVGSFFSDVCNVDRIDDMFLL